jgi:hypothetical protein
MSKSIAFDLAEFVNTRNRVYEIQFDAVSDTVRLSGDYRTQDLLEILSSILVGQQIASRSLLPKPPPDDPAFSAGVFNELGFTEEGRTRFLHYYGDGERVDESSREEALKMLRPISAPIYNLVNVDIDEKPHETLRKRFHAIGTQRYKDKWDEVRPRIVKAVSRGRAESSSDLCREEMQAIAVAMEIEIIHLTLI